MVSHPFSIVSLFTLLFFSKKFKRETSYLKRIPVEKRTNMKNKNEQLIQET